MLLLRLASRVLLPGTQARDEQMPIQQALQKALAGARKGIAAIQPGCPPPSCPVALLQKAVQLRAPPARLPATAIPCSAPAGCHPPAAAAAASVQASPDVHGRLCARAGTDGATRMLIQSASETAGSRAGGRECDCDAHRQHAAERQACCHTAPSAAAVPLPPRSAACAGVSAPTLPCPAAGSWRGPARHSTQPRRSGPRRRRGSTAARLLSRLLTARAEDSRTGTRAAAAGESGRAARARRPRWGGEQRHAETAPREIGCAARTRASRARAGREKRCEECCWQSC